MRRETMSPKTNKKRTAQPDSKPKAFIKALLWGWLVILFPVVSGVVAGITKLGPVPTLFVQSAFMALALAVPFICVLCRKWKWRDIGFGKLNAGGCRKALYFLPAVAIYIPVALSGLYVKSIPYLLGNLLLYLLVGVAEEIFFRGIVPRYLNNAFSRRGVIILSTLIFGVGHIATAFSGGDALSTALTVLNAFIFGWLAIEIALLSGNIAIPILLHFLFDFETKIILMTGKELMLAEGIRGTVMFLVALWLAFVLGKTDKASQTV